ncbi:MAG TPA: cytochrome c oxidase subunit II [Stenotrophobium sp.]|jgi:cytochrome c oxidase subunit 2|nr:cytochrome c oxidase subunit II [Stenotrophobium sp.]
MSKMSGLLRGWLTRCTALLGGLATMTAAHAEGLSYDGAKWNMPQGVSVISHEVYDMHMLAFYVCCAIGVLVFGVMFYSIFAHRRSKHPKPADFHESTTIEIIWTIIPFIILIGLAVPAAGTLIKMEDSSHSAMTVKVTGFQWKWHYEYAGQGVSFYSTLAADSNKARQLGSGIDPNTVPNYLVDVDHPLVLPIGEKIRFLITGNDVIHAWWVPDFAIKKDAIPGYVNEAWVNIQVPGTYRGVCAELCGRDHGFMPIVVKAVPKAEYEAWLTQEKAAEAAGNSQADVPVPVAGAATATTATATAATEAAPAPATPAAPAAAAGKDMSKADLIAAGAKVYAANCQACHQASGEGMPPNFPALKGSKIATGPVAGHIEQILNGKKIMPPFRQLSDTDIAAVATYERNSWGNDAGIVQPSQVAALRK